MRCQQDEVYAAEAPIHQGRRFSSQAEIQEWVDRLLNQPWWHERFPLVLNVEVPTIKRRRGEGSVGAYDAATGYGVIEMAEVHWNERDVCHELAHVTSGAEGSTAHDPLFVRHCLELVYRTIGTETWLALRASYLEHGVVIDERDDT